MNAITHFAAGMIGGLILIALIDLPLKDTTIVVFSGLFSMIPDIDQLIAQTTFLFDGWWGNLFWFHTVLDANETGYPVIEGTVALIVLLMVTVWHERLI